ncbi:MAG: hypothetical protein UX80_C0002G0075 [Candidatus Amesbacteria bacterium GW2011_GWA2_47_11b]|uniref:N-acetyltransferase domain-containing protein n=3 Tax=Candidatus Amesiibacteriota TaxID=1752730 RepID=A0A0G1SI67_9BACT|nr:MAG: hypothetical protein UX42_C0015G0008 [Microgenomates group bacterium GW2011_GWC1_46_20]KKU58540.1 MAG: hypothetical protein UX80_C0002G0075 [Candidatus Amesbacteria bacterium GW2011_GWA2_47_11b]KKU69101.1 MAG: hypothetical protein UX92_C0015G0008 [Candidatus Amesbacteria bacterium GW2011_GWA1_47_20]KKU83668.1 MAG: hypothetical protein UY11_C0015G0031 [Candidatus Amesbacteria bacterium GW2011_GWC2_47_8]
MTGINPWAVLVAEVRGEFAGNVFVLYCGWEADLYRLAVLERFRKLGVATKLLEAAETKLREIGVLEYALFAEVENQSLIDFYLKRGFNRVPKPYSIMWKSLR